MRTGSSFRGLLSPGRRTGYLPFQDKHHHREHDRRNRCEYRNQDRVSADVDTADPGQYAVDQGEKSTSTKASPRCGAVSSRQLRNGISHQMILSDWDARQGAAFIEVRQWGRL